MPQPKAVDFRGRSRAELEEELKNYYIELHNLRRQRAISQLPDPKRIKMVRKTIARILTVLSEEQAVSS